MIEIDKKPCLYHDCLTSRSVLTSVHGRYLVVPPTPAGPAPMLIGFHGYAEDAEVQLERLGAIPGSAGWLCVSIQALHRFYERRTNRVVASWMTRQDRESAISDNLKYVSTCIDAVASEWPTAPEVVFAGFSQGVAMAYRAAVHAERGPAGMISVGGDIPPEFGPSDLQRIPAALIARGDDDGLYTRDKFADDERRLRECGVSVARFEFAGGHEWSRELAGAASKILAAIHDRH